MITAAEQSHILKCLPLIGPEILNKFMCCFQLLHGNHSTAPELYTPGYVI